MVGHFWNFFFFWFDDYMGVVVGGGAARLNFEQHSFRFISISKRRGWGERKQASEKNKIRMLGDVDLFNDDGQSEWIFFFSNKNSWEKKLDLNKNLSKKISH